jgi:hypothetical protein
MLAGTGRERDLGRARVADPQLQQRLTPEQGVGAAPDLHEELEDFRCPGQLDLELDADLASLPGSPGPPLPRRGARFRSGEPHEQARSALPKAAIGLWAV